MNTRALICPVSSERINEKVVRANAFFTILVVVAGIWFQSLSLLVFLAVDFFIRAFVQSQVSPIAFISRKSINMLGLGNKAIDKAPKIFAARLGFVMTFLVSVFVMSGWTAASLTVAGILVLFAALELTVGFCAGCYLYTYFVYPLMGKNN